jgi:hypothetical protein
VVFRDAVSAAGLSVRADAPPASNKDITPATPAAGRAFFRPFATTFFLSSSRSTELRATLQRVVLCDAVTG